MEKNTKKSTAALENGSTLTMTSTDSIAYPCQQCKGIKKIEGWTLAPELPKEKTWYMTIRAFRGSTGEIVTYYMVDHYFYPDTFSENLVAWKQMPKVPKWAEKIASGMAIKEV